MINLREVALYSNDASFTLPSNKVVDQMYNRWDRQLFRLCGNTI